MAHGNARRLLETGPILPLPIRDPPARASNSKGRNSDAASGLLLFSGWHGL